MAWLAHIHTLDIYAQPQTLYVSAGLEAPVVEGILHEEITQTILKLETEVFQGYGQASASASKGDLVLVTDYQLDSWKQHFFKGGLIEVYEGDGDELAGYTLRFAGTIENATHDETSLKLTLRDASWRADRPLDIPTFDGSGELEGDENLRGKKKPLIIGEPLAIDPTPYLIDGLYLIYMMSYRGFEAAIKATDGGNELTYRGNYADLDALRAAPITSGEYAVCLSLGLIRLGGRVAKKLAVWVQGDNVGGYVNRPGALITRVNSDFADKPIELDATALAALDVAHDYPLGFYINQEVNVASVYESIAVAAGAAWWVTRLGKLTAKVIGLGTPVETLTEEDWSDFPKIEDRDIVKEFRIGYARIESVHSAAEVATITSEDIPGLPDALDKLEGIQPGADVSVNLIETHVHNPGFAQLGDYWTSSVASGWRFESNPPQALSGDSYAVFDADAIPPSIGAPHGSAPHATYPHAGLFNGTTSKSLVNSKKFLIREGESQPVLGVLKGSTGTDIEMALGIEWYKDDGELIGTDIGLGVVPGTTWQIIEHIFTAPVGAFLGKFVWVPKTFSTGSVTIDQVRFDGTGLDGRYKDYRYLRAADQPATPAITEIEPVGWSDGIPPHDGNPAWEIWAWKRRDDTLLEGWTDPVNIRALDVEREYSINGINNWHFPPEPGDAYFRERAFGSTEWSDPVLIKGEKGDPGSAWYSGTGAPSSALGTVNDYYLNRGNGDVYVKTSGTTWTLDGNINGGDGDKWHSGSGAPSSALGTDGDLYLDVDSGDVYVKASGAWSVDTNIEGPPGAPGAQWHNGSGAPAGTTGAINDYYLNQDSGDVYRKTDATTWSLEGNINGNDGDKWHSGSGAPSSGLGTDGDRYLNLDNGDVYVKASGSWSVDTNIVGPAGAQWHNGSGAPSGATGAIGDYYLNQGNGDVYKKTGASTWSLEGNINGDDGDKWHSGSGAPSGSLGTDGDRYLRNDTGDVYVKSGGSWSIDTNIEGPPGNPGADGVGMYAAQINTTGTGSYNDDYIRFCGYSGGSVDTTEPAKIQKPDGSFFSFGGTTGNGESTLLIHGTNTGGYTGYYIVVDLSGAKRFTHGAGVARHVAACRKAPDGSWTYMKQQVGWAALPGSDHSDFLVIGTADRDEASPHAWLNYSYTMMTLDAAPELGAVRTSDTEHIANNATSLPKYVEDTNLLLNYQSQGYATVATAITGIPFTTGEGAAVKLSFTATFRCNDDPLKLYARWQRRPAGGTWETIRTMDQLIHVTGIGSATQRLSAASKYTDVPDDTGTYEYRLQAWGNGEQENLDRAYLDNFTFEVEAVRK